VVLELAVKSVNKEFWPLLQWANGDELLYHSVTNTVHQYSRTTGFKGMLASAAAVCQQYSNSCPSKPAQDIPPTAPAMLR